MKTVVEKVDCWTLDGALKQPFAISTGSHTKVDNVLVRVTLSDGTRGWGEAAPAAHITGETQAATLAAAKLLGKLALGRSAAMGPALAREFEEAYPKNGAARAGLETALFDAALRRLGVPAWRFLGARKTLVRSDVTIPLCPIDDAPVQAAALWKRGVRTLKVKIGRHAEEDLRRVKLIVGAAPRAALILDANQGYDAKRAAALWKALAAAGIRPVLFEQPVPKADWDGLASLTRAGVPVCADESVSTRDDARRMAKAKAVRAVNVKLMKSGLWQALEIAEISRRAGFRLMIGGMLESSLAMGCGAHIAAAMEIEHVDLDTPVFFAANPMRGLAIRRNATYELSTVRAGVGARPRKEPPL